MNNLSYVNRFLGGMAKIVSSYSFMGPKGYDIKQSQIQKLYNAKQFGSKKAKAMLVQSTGYLSIIDRPSYYHMIQYIKFWLLDTVYKYGLENDVVGVQTDCLFVRVCEETQDALQQLRVDDISLANKPSTIGKYKFERVNYTDIISKKARVVLI